jgi:hypothetical protein
MNETRAPSSRRTIAAGGDGGKMDEDVFAIFFSRVKPLYCACLSHFSSTSEIPNFLPYRLSIAEVITLGARSADASDGKD